MRVGELVEILCTSERRALRAIGPIVAVERYTFGAHAWEIATVRVPLGRFGVLDVHTFSEHVRPAHTLAQDERRRAEERRDPETVSVDRVLGLSRVDPAPPSMPLDSAKERLESALGWTRVREGADG